MADRSYTWPSVVDTGSVITSSVIEHIALHGGFKLLLWALLVHEPHTHIHTDLDGRGQMIRTALAAANAGVPIRRFSFE